MTYEIAYFNGVEGLDLDDRYREVKNLLVEHDCEVTFTKVTGEVRTMHCTLRAAALPERVIKEDSVDTARVQKTTVINVFDLDRQAWRSFRTANITHVKVIEHV